MTDAQYSEIRKEMRAFRVGMAPLPQSYVDLHAQCAKADLLRFLEGRQATLIATMMVSDGHFDGMKVLSVSACHKGNIVTFQWSDSNGGSWFAKLRHGSALVETAPNGPGYL